MKGNCEVKRLGKKMRRQQAKRLKAKKAFENQVCKIST